MVRIEDVNSLGLEIPFVFTHSISSSSYTPRSEERSRRSRMSATRWPDGWYGVSRACKEMRKESDTVRATDEGRRDLSSLTFHLLTLFILSLPWSFYTSSLFVCSLQSHPRSRGERRTTDRERGWTERDGMWDETWQRPGPSRQRNRHEDGPNLCFHVSPRSSSLPSSLTPRFGVHPSLASLLTASAAPTGWMRWERQRIGSVTTVMKNLLDPVSLGLILCSLVVTLPIHR